MRINNDFKTVYWLIVVVSLSIFLYIRIEDLVSVNMTTLDPYVFIFWCVLVMLPLFNEISVGGFTFKKEFEKFSDEIRRQILDIKLDNRNNNNNSNNVYVGLAVSRAEKEEYADKLNKEVKENGDLKIGLSFEHEEKKQVTPKNEYAQNKLEKIKRIEELVREKMVKRHGDNFSSEMKIENNLGNKVILDGIVFFRKNKIKEVIEIKFITSKSFENFRFIWGRFVNRLLKLGIDRPIRLIIVSEDMDQESAYKIKQDLTFLSILGKDLDKQFWVYFEFFRFEHNTLVEIKAQKSDE